MSKTVTLVGLALLTGCKSEGIVGYLEGRDEFAQAPNNEVDILWVVDNSNSMAEEQETLTDGFASFAAELDASNTNFHLGVITTSFMYDDPDRATLIGDPPYLTLDDDYVPMFQARTTVGTGGSDKEKGLEAALYALSPTMTLPGGNNAGFVRESAQLLIVFVSDEEDCSDGGALEGQPATACYTATQNLTPVGGWIEELRALKDDPTSIQIGSIVGLPNSACDNVYSGSRYVEAALLTGGLAGDICRSDWNSMLASLGLNATGIRTTFQLTRAAQPDTLLVMVDGVEAVSNPVNGWTYDVDSWYITFHGTGIPPRGSVIVAEYTVDPTRQQPEVAPSAVTGTVTP